VGRAIWVNYKITDKRVSVASTSPLNMEKLDATYDQMVEVRAIGRGVGLWGDMVIVLNDGAKIEIRCIDRCVATRRSKDRRCDAAPALPAAAPRCLVLAHSAHARVHPLRSQVAGDQEVHRRADGHRCGGQGEAFGVQETQRLSCRACPLFIDVLSRAARPCACARAAAPSARSATSARSYATAPSSRADLLSTR
jgi:hypothetical protein